MSYSASPDSLKSFVLATYRRHADSGLVPFAKPSITVSRETGSDGEAICQLLGERLTEAMPGAWSVWDRNLLHLVLKEMQLSEKVAEFLPEAGRSGVEAFVRELLGVHPSMWTMVEKTNETIERLARVGNVIIVGRGAHLVAARHRKTFSVRIVCPLEERVRRLAARREELDRDGAREVIQKEDRDKEEYLAKHFHRDINDPHDYDLVVNTRHLKPREAVALIEKAFVEFLKGQED
ncbi:MAG: cytidylate kinase-like family protein [Opitutales bacterium]|nr:cytidylate kinase-like family protein [Opitutales bacterium]MCH8540829.1 cytidylate kinase-like family protein [Opitutales bacterium]